jgi:hypothetical protein
MTFTSIYRTYNKQQILSNFFIVFYVYESDLSIKNSIDIHDKDSANKLLDSITNDETVYISYNIESLNAFTIFLSNFLETVINMPTKKERLNLCILNSIIINPNLI